MPPDPLQPPPGRHRLLDVPGLCPLAVSCQAWNGLAHLLGLEQPGLLRLGNDHYGRCSAHLLALSCRFNFSFSTGLQPKQKIEKYIPSYIISFKNLHRMKKIS
ncbi:hypothetical protein ABFS83_04G230400 [Erythranthe nasuta]